MARVKTVSNQCIIANCDNPIKPKSRFNICQLCRSSICRWIKRTPKEVAERVRRLGKYSNRMNNLDYRGNRNGS